MAAQSASRDHRERPIKNSHDHSISQGWLIWCLQGYNVVVCQLLREWGMRHLVCFIARYGMMVYCCSAWTFRTQDHSRPLSSSHQLGLTRSTPVLTLKPQDHKTIFLACYDAVPHLWNKLHFFVFLIIII